MPIQGLTTRDGSFFELGIIRKGGAKTDSHKPGPDLDFFRFVSADRQAMDAFKKVFGDQPREIDFVVPFPTLEENFEAWREAYVASGLSHRCDGVTCVAWRDERGKMQFTPKPCPTPTDEQRKNGGCKQVCRMKIIIPALKRFAFITVTSTSIYDIISLHQQLLGVQLANDGNLRGVPLILRRVQREISTPSKDGRARRKKWLLCIEPHQSWVEKKLLEHHNQAMGLIEATKAPLMIETTLPEEVDEENDDAHSTVEAVSGSEAALNDALLKHCVELKKNERAGKAWFDAKYAGLSVEEKQKAALDLKLNVAYAALADLEVIDGELVGEEM